MAWLRAAGRTLPLVAMILLFALAASTLREQRFRQAVQGGDVATVRQMLDDGRDPSQNAMGSSVLMVAVMRDRREVAKLLLERGADVNMPLRPWGSTPLTRAIEAHNPTMLRLLIQYRANVNVVTKHGSAWSIAQRELSRTNGSREAKEVVAIRRAAGAR